MRAKQEIFISEAKKLQDYLVVPNNLLLSLGIQAYSHSSFFLIAYAREAGRATPTGKGLPWSFPRPLTRALLSSRQRAK